MNKSAQQLGRMAKGCKKTMTLEAIKARRENLAKARMSRWKHKDK